jgi:hypothetical protein
MSGDGELIVESLSLSNFQIGRASSDFFLTISIEFLWKLNLGHKFFSRLDFFYNEWIIGMFLTILVQFSWLDMLFNCRYHNLFWFY